MSKLHERFKTTRLSIWLLLCTLILAATSVYAAGNERPLTAVDILGSPDAAVDGQFAVGTSTLGNKALTVAGVIDFVGAGTVHNYFTQGPGNNMQIRSNVDEYNSVDDSSYAQWNMVIGASLDVFSIRRSPAGSTYDEDALFWIDGATGNVGISTFDTGNGATIPIVTYVKLHVQTSTGHGIYAGTDDTTGGMYGIYGSSESSSGWGVYGSSNGSEGHGVYGKVWATSGVNYGVYGYSASIAGHGVYGYASATSGDNYGVYGRSQSNYGIGVYGEAQSGVWGVSDSTSGTGVRGIVTAATGPTIAVTGISSSTEGRGVWGYADASSGTNYGVFGQSVSSAGYDFYAGGSGTDYGPFTGAHEVLLSDSFPVEVKPGMIVSGTGQTHIRRTPDGSVDISSTLPTVKLASTAKDKAVLGVLVAEITLPEDHWYMPVDGERFASVNALGEGRVWVTNINGDIEAGDFITTSIIPGYGQRQDGSRLNNFTLAKSMDTVDWENVLKSVTINGKEYKVYLLAVVYTSG